jgi:hypothetical protein
MSLNFKSCDTRSCKVSFFGSAGGALRIGIEGPPITTNGQEADKMFQRKSFQASIKFGRTGHRRRGMAGVTAEVVADQLQDARQNTWRDSSRQHGRERPHEKLSGREAGENMGSLPPKPGFSSAINSQFKTRQSF